MTILGGGYIGCEFASMFALFGSQVTLVQGPSQLLPNEDPDTAAEISGILTTQGVTVRTGVRVARSPRHPDEAG